MTAAQAAENHGVERGLNWYLQWGIYTSIPTWTYSQNSPATAEAPSLKIFSYGASLKLFFLLARHFYHTGFFGFFWPTQALRPMQKFQHMPFFLTHAKILWIHPTHITHTKVWPTPPKIPHTYATLATHAV